VCAFNRLFGRKGTLISTPTIKVKALAIKRVRNDRRKLAEEDVATEKQKVEKSFHCGFRICVASVRKSADHCQGRKFPANSLLRTVQSANFGV
jgi:3-methyladenine DNA glycosylase Mpg